MAYYGYPPYVSVAEKRARAERKLRQLRKKYPDLRPVIIEGRTLVRTWWGNEWNGNLEKYADYTNRIERGRSYVRHGTVLDLQISRGQISAMVQGSRRDPYKVAVESAGPSGNGSGPLVRTSLRPCTSCWKDGSLKLWPSCSLPKAAVCSPHRPRLSSSAIAPTGPICASMLLPPFTA